MLVISGILLVASSTVLLAGTLIMWIVDGGFSQPAAFLTHLLAVSICGAGVAVEAWYFLSIYRKAAAEGIRGGLYEVEKIPRMILAVLLMTTLVWIAVEYGVTDETGVNHTLLLSWTCVIMFFIVAPAVCLCLGWDAADLEKRLAESDHRQRKQQA